jgi:hypothetical protein
MRTFSLCEIYLGITAIILLIVILIKRYNNIYKES